VTAEPAAPQTAVQRDYVVLRDNTPQPNTANSLAGTITILKVKAKSPHDAIRQVADNKAGTYRAVLAKSFAPVKVTVHTETTIRLG